jgi:cell division protein FtsZ
MGGGTGTGAAPVIARMARERNILTVGVVTKPFGFEGVRRARCADQGIEELQQYVDTLIVIPNQNLFRMANERTTWKDAFKMADQVLYMGVRGVTDLMMAPGLVNLDFADIRTVMAEMGKAMMGTGEAEGENRAIRASEAAISNPLLEDTSMAGARGLLINITGGDDLTLFEVDQAANRIREEVDEEANIIFGSAIDESLSGRIRVSVVATGIDTPVAAATGPRLVAMAGGAMPPPQPIPMPLQAAGLVATHATVHPVHPTVMSAAPLRQQSAQMRAQTEQIMDGNAALELPSVATPTTVPPQPTPTRINPGLTQKASSTLFNEVRPTAAPAALPQVGEQSRTSLFRTVTAPFRRRPTPLTAVEMAAPRHEPMLRSELRTEVPLPSARPASGSEEPTLEIPAFLRRQDLMKRDALG